MFVYAGFGLGIFFMIKSWKARHGLILFKGYR